MSEGQIKGQGIRKSAVLGCVDRRFRWSESMGRVNEHGHTPVKGGVRKTFRDEGSRLRHRRRSDAESISYQLLPNELSFSAPACVGAGTTRAR